MGSEIEAVAERLGLLRKALGLSSAELCRQIGMLPSAWSMFESGQRRFTLEAAMVLRKKYGASVDWIFFGDEACLPKRLFDLIETARAKMKNTAAE